MLCTINSRAKIILLIGESDFLRRNWLQKEMGIPVSAKRLWVRVATDAVSEVRPEVVVSPFPDIAHFLLQRTLSF